MCEKASNSCHFRCLKRPRLDTWDVPTPKSVLNFGNCRFPSRSRLSISSHTIKKSRATRLKVPQTQLTKTNKISEFSLLFTHTVNPQTVHNAPILQIPNLKSQNSPHEILNKKIADLKKLRFKEAEIIPFVRSHLHAATEELCSQQAVLFTEQSKTQKTTERITNLYGVTY